MSENQNVPETHLGNYAGFVTRLVAFIIDQIIVGAMIFLIGVVARYVYGMFNVNEWLGIERLSTIIMAAIVVLLSISVVLIYFLGFWQLSGQTVGKWLMGVRIVRTSGERITGRRALIRYLGYWLSAILFLGYLWVLVDDRRQGLHDKLGGTYVVYAWPEEEASRPIKERLHRASQKRLQTKQDAMRARQESKS